MLAGLLQKRITFTAAKSDMPNIVIDVITAKKVAAPRSLLEFYLTITHPLASAKSAMDHMKNQTIVMRESR